MKKIFLASLSLMLFAIALTLVQLSCSKSDAQNRPANATALNKVLYTYVNSSTVVEFWLADYSGANQTQINLSLPANISLSTYLNEVNPRLSPDGSKIFFRGWDTNASHYVLCSADIDGSNVTPIVNIPSGSANLVLHDVY